MSGRSVKVYFLFVLLALLLSGCAVRGDSEVHTLESLAEAGELALIDPAGRQTAQHTLAEVGVGDFFQTWEIPAAADVYTYPILFSEVPEGGGLPWHIFLNARYTGIEFRVGDRVNEGDFLSELYFDEISESLEIDIYALNQDRNRFEARASADRNRMLAEMENLRHELARASDDDWELLALRLDLAQLAFRQFMDDTARQRRDFESRMERMTSSIRGERLYAPIDGVISYVTLNAQPGWIRDITVMNIGGVNTRRLATIVDDSRLAFTATAPLHALRYGDVVTLTDLNQTFFARVRVMADPMVLPVSRGENMTFRLVPEDEEAFNAVLAESGLVPLDLLNMVLRVRSEVSIVQNAVVVDRRAIQTRDNRHYVMVYNNGVLGRRYVELGAQMGNQVQILSGLVPGQMVVI